MIATIFGFTMPSSANAVVVSSDAFVNAIGINVHLHYTDTAYYKRFQVVEQLLEELGIRHLRDNAIDTTNQAVYDHFIDLGKHGIKTTFFFSPRVTTDFVRTFPSRVPGAYEGFEAPNELNDQSNEPDWDSTLRTFQPLLYATIKSTAITSAIPVIGPSITKREDDVKLGDLSQYMDYGNIHNYFGGQNPGSAGTGSLGQDSIKYNQQWVKYQSGSRPVISTETGYCDFDQLKGTPADVNGKYEPRMFLEQYLHGIVRTIQYELLDTGNPAGFGGHCGLLTNELRLKPSYNALKGMIGLLADPGPKYTPAPFDVSITPNVPNLQYVVFGKRDGSYVLAVWIEASDFDVPKRTKKAVPSQSVTVVLPGGKRSGLIYTYDGAENLHSHAVTIGSAGEKLEIGDRVTYVKLGPKSLLQRDSDAVTNSYWRGQHGVRISFHRPDVGTSVRLPDMGGMR